MINIWVLGTYESFRVSVKNERGVLSKFGNNITSPVKQGHARPKLLNRRQWARCSGFWSGGSGAARRTARKRPSTLVALQQTAAEEAVNYYQRQGLFYGLFPKIGVDTGETEPPKVLMKNMGSQIVALSGAFFRYSHLWLLYGFRIRSDWIGSCIDDCVDFAERVKLFKMMLNRKSVLIQHTTAEVGKTLKPDSDGDRSLRSQLRRTYVVVSA